jgi:hypothetical protein
VGGKGIDGNGRECDGRGGEGEYVGALEYGEQEDVCDIYVIYL